MQRQPRGWRTLDRAPWTQVHAPWAGLPVGWKLSWAGSDFRSCLCGGGGRGNLKEGSLVEAWEKGV